MSELMMNSIEVQQLEEELNQIRCYLKRGNYIRAEEEMAHLETKYQSLLEDVRLEDLYCTVLALKLEIFTRGFSKIEIGWEEEKRIVGWYRILVRLNRLPVKATHYLYKREDYIRSQKKLEFQETRKTLCTDMICGILVLLFSILFLCGIKSLFEELSFWVINGAVFIGSIGLFVLFLQDCMRSAESYQKWQDYLQEPVPFEMTSLF